MIPFHEQPVFNIGPLSIHAFGVAVAVAIAVGLEMATRRFGRAGLDSATGQTLAAWIVTCGLIGAHLFSVLFYFPEKVAADPWLLLRVWEDISSFGGMLGGIAGAALYLKFRAPLEHRQKLWAYLDAAAFVFPFSLALGRVGCALAHDHPGRITRFPLAISLQTGDARDFIAGVYSDAGLAAMLPSDTELAGMGFHDLGLYEMLFLFLVLLPVLVLANRRPRAEGFYVLCFAGLYLPVRFALDFLRVADARYAGLTPAQWVAGVAFLSLPLLWRRIRPRVV